MKVILLIMIGLSYLNGAEIFKDTKTGLMWQDNYDAKSVQKKWSEAKSYCKKLTLNGYSDWRLPSIKELQSIVDITRYDPAIKKGFKNVASYGYWSSSPGVSDDSYAWSVYFSSGDTYSYDLSNKLYVRCVRGRQ